MVRLKGRKVLYPRLIQYNFNSSMVRLKAKESMDTPRFALFQFLYGAIKSAKPLIKAAKVALFQFLYGAIKSKYNWVSKTA